MKVFLQIASAKCSMKHAEVVIARQAVEEGRGLVVIVNKMDLLRGKRNSEIYESVMKAVPEEIQTVIPQVGYIISYLFYPTGMHALFVFFTCFYSRYIISFLDCASFLLDSRSLFVCILNRKHL